MFFFIVKTTNLDTTMTSIGYVIQISRSYQKVKDDDVFDQFFTFNNVLKPQFFSNQRSNFYYFDLF